MVAERVKDKQARARNSSLAATKNRSPYPSATDPATTMSSTSSSADERRDGASDQLSAPDDDGPGSLGRRPPGDGGDGRPRGFGFETAPGAARAAAAVGLHDHMAHVTGVAGCAVDQTTAEDDAPTDPG